MSFFLLSFIYQVVIFVYQLFYSRRDSRKFPERNAPAKAVPERFSII